MVGTVELYEVGVPHPRLQPFVAEYIGYDVRGFLPGVEIGLPSGALTLVVSFREPVHISGDFREGSNDSYWGLVGGLHTSPALINHSGNQHGVQLAITPAGAVELLGVPASELSQSVVHLEQVIPSGTQLIDRLSEADCWPQRWQVLDRFFLQRIQGRFRWPDELQHAWNLMQLHEGTVGVAEMADAVGWSRRHLGQQFRRHTGLPPKAMARVFRFQRAQRLLRSPSQPSLASVAAACGYSDQAHMTREWRQFAGTTPTNWLSTELLPILQDEGEPVPS